MISIIASTAKGFMDLSDREVFSWVGLGWVGLGIDYGMSIVEFPLYIAKCSPKKMRSFLIGF